MSLAAGVPPPSPDDFTDAGEVHAIDGDGTALCTGGDVEQIDQQLWADVPDGQRCPTCQMLSW